MKARSVGMLVICGMLSPLLIGGPVAQAHPAGRHCAFRLEPASHPRPNVVSARLVRVGCYGTVSEAIEAGTDGAVRVPRSTTPAELTERLIVTSTTARIGGGTLIGTEWTSLNYTGSSKSYMAPDACAGNIWEVDYVGDNWNDEFESGKGFGGCDTNKKFGHVDFGGAVVTCTPNCGNYGELRNQVSSLRWRP
jgi:hypothetical protein